MAAGGALILTAPVVGNFAENTINGVENRTPNVPSESTQGANENTSETSRSVGEIVQGVYQFAGGLSLLYGAGVISLMGLSTRPSLKATFSPKRQVEYSSEPNYPMSAVARKYFEQQKLDKSRVSSTAADDEELTYPVLGLNGIQIRGVGRFPLTRVSETEILEGAWRLRYQMDRVDEAVRLNVLSSKEVGSDEEKPILDRLQALGESMVALQNREMDIESRLMKSSNSDETPVELANPYTYAAQESQNPTVLYAAAEDEAILTLNQAFSLLPGDEKKALVQTFETLHD